jgi:hypothetical protein
MNKFGLAIKIFRFLGLFCSLLCLSIIIMSLNDAEEVKGLADNYRIVLVMVIGVVVGALFAANPNRFVDRLYVRQLRQPKGLDNLPLSVVVLLLSIMLIGVYVYWRHLSSG